VTSEAPALWSRGASHVLRVVELHVEAFFEFVRESFARRIVAIHVLMAD
jgi:hypothetical protein